MVFNGVSGPEQPFWGRCAFFSSSVRRDPVDPSIRPAAGPRADVAGQAVGTDAVSPDNPDPAVLEETRLAETALGLLDAGRYEQAEQLLRGEVDEHSEQDRLRFLLGIALQKQKRYGSALVELDRAIGHNLLSCRGREGCTSRHKDSN